MVLKHKAFWHVPTSVLKREAKAVNGPWFDMVASSCPLGVKVMFPRIRMAASNLHTSFSVIQSQKRYRKRRKEKDTLLVRETNDIHSIDHFLKLFAVIDTIHSVASTLAKVMVLVWLEKSQFTCWFVIIVINHWWWLEEVMHTPERGIGTSYQVVENVEVTLSLGLVNHSGLIIKLIKCMDGDRKKKCTFSNRSMIHLGKKMVSYCKVKVKMWITYN